MRTDIPFEGRRMSICQKCGLRKMTTNGFCDRCRTLGFGSERERFYDNPKQSEEEKAKSKELGRLQELKKRELESPPTDEELEEVLKKRTRIYDRKKEKKEEPVPTAVDATFRG